MNTSITLKLLACVLLFSGSVSYAAELPKHPTDASSQKETFQQCPVAACNKYKIYDVPGGPYYTKIIEGEPGEKNTHECFKTIEQAKKAGFKKAS